MNQEEESPAPFAPGPHPALVRATEHEWLHNARIITPLINYNLAYLAVAQGAGRIPNAAGRTLASCLLEVRSEGIDGIGYRPERDGLQPNLEAEVTARVGAEAGGWLSIGRARQECELVARQIAERDDLLAVLEGAASLLRVLATLARREADAVMPYYTWMQQAEPITFGYFAAATGHAIAADCERLEQAFRRLDTARAGAGQVVPPPFAIDREAIAALLGFDGVLSNSMHAYGSLDIEIEVLSAMTTFCAHTARLADTLFVWAAPEFGFLRFASEFTGASYAMPQKQNPYVLRLARPIAGRAIGAMNDALQLFSGSLPLVGNGLIHVPNRVLTLLGEVADLCALLQAGLPTVSLDRERMREAAATGWAGAPQLVYYLVERHDISFRQAHEICGQVVRRAMGHGLVAGALPAALVEERVAAVTGRAVSVNEESMRAALAPESIVASRFNGGPAPGSVQREAETLERLAGGFQERVEGKREVLAQAAHTLDARVRAFV